MICTTCLSEELFIYGPKYDGVVYQKIYIDVENKKLIGKQNELAPWKELSPIQTVERVIL